MKGNEIIDRINSNIRSKMPDIEQVREKCLSQSSQSAGKTGAKNKKTNKFILKPMFAAVICMILITTAIAAAPFVLKILGSENISFFDTDKQVRYSSEVELIKQYSTEVGMTAEGDGYKLTIDNIAFDGTFLSVFYTIQKDVNIIEEVKEIIRKDYVNNPELMAVQENSKKAIDYYVNWRNLIGLEINGYKNDMFNKDSDMRETYIVSEHELKGMRRFIITEDLPDIFDIKINYISNDISLLYKGDKTVHAESLSLTVDLSENKIETLIIEPDLSAAITVNGIYDLHYYTVEHNITINKVSMSPLGNIIVFTEPVQSDAPKTFNNFYILDDKNHFYAHENWYLYNRDKNTYPVEFFGDITPDTQYLKLIPYNMKFTENEKRNNSIDIENAADYLPARFKYSEYGDIIVESLIFNDEEVSITYRTEGIVGNFINYNCLDENDDLLYAFLCSVPRYDKNTGLYTVNAPNVTMMNPGAENIKKFSIEYTKINLLEDQAIIIPLK